MKCKLWSVLGLVLMIVVALTACSSGGSSSRIAITSYSLDGVAGTINDKDKTIAVTLPYGTNVHALIATFKTTGVSVNVGSTLQVSGVTANDFTTPVTYTVVVTNDATQNYIVTVTVLPSSAKAITAYSLLGVAGTVNETAKTIAVTLPFGTDLTALAATFTTTGAGVKVGSTLQVSGTTTNDFTSPVTYAVTAANATTQNYVITITLYPGGTWTQKKDFGGTGRESAVAFSVGTNGYLGTGYDGTVYHSDFWAYDSTTDIWTQKADFKGGKRASAVAFAIGTKGYVGTGYDGTAYYNDFWEYDTATNKWTQKADFGGTDRKAAVGFSNAGKGYIGTGFDGTQYLVDFWAYDPSTDKWTKKANFAGGKRGSAVGLSISGIGYIGTGFDGKNYYNDFWAYDPATDKWTQKANFAGTTRMSAVAVYCSCYGYVGLGTGPCACNHNDFWEYDPTADKWIRKADFPSGDRVSAVGFAIGCNDFYVGTGSSKNLICPPLESTCITTTEYNKDLWKFTP